MVNKIDISIETQKLIVYIVLIVVTFAVFWQVNRYDFVNFDDHYYVIKNSDIQSGKMQEGVRWAFSTKYSGLWNPLIWLSFMVDYQLFGLNAGGYHLTNVILHILSTLLLFWFFHRMTGAIWKSAFVAGLFALHPLHVESVAWISERKDVLSAFFWMLTLCFYVYYTERPVIRRYLLVVLAFVLALMSKPMVITLPVVMILLDYWPLKRFESKKGNLFLWQMKEKTLFFILSLVTVIITLYNPATADISGTSGSGQIPLIVRSANTPVAFVRYLEKTFWPHDMAFFYPFPVQIPGGHVLIASLLIIIISVAVIALRRRLPYLFVGWMWFSITIAPVIGIVQISLITPYSMADRYHYLPSIGIAIMMVWGISSLIKSKEARERIIFPAGIAFLSIMALLAWKQCSYWENSTTVFIRAINVTKDNYLAYNLLASALIENGNILEAIDHCNIAIRLAPYYAEPYNNRGRAHHKLGQYQQAIKDYNKAIRLKTNYVESYNNRGVAYGELGKYQQAIEDYSHAISMKQDYAESYNNRGTAYAKLGQYNQAIKNFDQAVLLKSDYDEAYKNRGLAYLLQNNQKLGCLDLQKACELGNCKLLENAKSERLCN